MKCFLAKGSFRVESLQGSFSAFIGGFVRLFFISVMVWMVGLIVLLWREMFRPGKLMVREYMYQVWKTFYFSLEWVAYLGIFIAPLCMIWTKQYLIYAMMTIDSLLLSSLYLLLRQRRRRLAKLSFYKHQRRRQP
jgi:hypothetical protein